MNRAEQNKANTIEQIRKSFMSLYANSGIEKFTVQQICETAGISRTIFYRYFDDKYSVLEDIENMILDTGMEYNNKMINVDFSGHASGSPYPIFYELMKYAYDNKKYFKPLIGPNGDPQFIFRWKKYIRKDITQKLKHDQMNPDNLKLKISFFAAGLVELFIYWFYEKPSLTPEKMSEYAGQLLTRNFYQ